MDAAPHVTQRARDVTDAAPGITADAPDSTHAAPNTTAAAASLLRRNGQDGVPAANGSVPRKTALP